MEDDEWRKIRGGEKGLEKEAKNLAKEKQTDIDMKNSIYKSGVNENKEDNADTDQANHFSSSSEGDSDN